VGAWQGADSVRGRGRGPLAHGRLPDREVVGAGWVGDSERGRGSVVVGDVVEGRLDGRVAGLER